MKVTFVYHRTHRDYTHSTYYLNVSLSLEWSIPKTLFVSAEAHYNFLFFALSLSRTQHK